MRGRTLRIAFGVLEAALAAALAVGVAGCSSGAGGASTSGSAAPVKIGAIVSLTGSYAAMGLAEKQALELEVKRINDAGGVGGKKIELVIVDDGTDEAKAVAKASELIEREKVVAILGATGTGQSMAIRSELTRSGVPEISMAGGNAITGTFDKLVFQTPWSNAIIIPSVLKRMAADGHKKIGVMTDSSGYGKDGLAIINSAASAAGLTVVSSQTFNPGDTDFSAQLTRLKNSDADSILLWTAGKEGASIVKASVQLGIRLPMYGGSGQAKVEFPQGAGSAAENFVFCTGKSLIPLNWGKDSEEYKVVNDFAQRYKAAYGQDPDIFAGHAFDALNIAVDAIKRTSGEITPSKLRDSIEQTKDLVGFAGKFSFSATNHNGLTEADLSFYRIQNGTWVTIK
ncbi:MAG: ABC transporter substrate-binding protein [Coriobacteriia bacterium]|nr:ABC transporter substrate-binding protein [Coriobacteriia bacterium]